MAKIFKKPSSFDKGFGAYFVFNKLKNIFYKTLKNAVGEIS